MKPRAPHRIAALACVLACALQPALAAAAPQADDAAAKDDAAVVHVNAIRDPELRAYRAIAAGLDSFDKHRALAPNAPQLLFQAQARAGGALQGEPVAVRLAADEFSLPLAVDAENRFAVPRNEQAWDAKAELVTNRKQMQAKIVPYVRSSGLAPNARRLGDIRLECQVRMAIVKEQIPLYAILAINGALRARDWCSTYKSERRSFAVPVAARLSGATLREGARSLALKVDEHGFFAPIADAGWSDEAIVELAFAGGEAAQ